MSGINYRDFPKRNRTYDMLGALDIQIQSMDGSVLKMDPNLFVKAAITDSFDLGPPVGPSFLSGGQGWLFRDEDFGVVLTREEIRRLGTLELTPAQYFKLREHFGMFFQIHDDFYDETTGAALQPRGLYFGDEDAEDDEVRPPGKP